MRITSFKKAVFAGIIYAVATFITYLLFTYLLNFLLGGENFVYKGETREFVNGISFTVVRAVGIIISLLIPIFLLRFKSSDYYIVSIFVATVLYVLFLTVMLLGIPKDLLKNSAFNSFDCIIYGIFDFPFGACVGLLVTPLINKLLFRNKERI